MLAAVLISLPGSVLADPAEVPRHFDSRPAVGRRPLAGRVLAFPIGEVGPAPLPVADPVEVRRPRPTDASRNRAATRQNRAAQRRFEGAWR
jgi:hypothetical protein